MKATTNAFTILILSIVFLSVAEPARPVNKLGTVYAADGKKIRGLMINFYNAPNNTGYIRDDAKYTKTVSLKLNAIRYWVRRQYKDGKLYTGTYGSYPMATTISLLDAAVAQCAKFNLYCVIDCHVLDGQTGTLEMNDAKDFWSNIAPRYKDRTHVIYELFNEPTYGAGLSSAGIAKMVDLYKHVRAMAPKTHLITFSMGKFSYSSTVEATLDNTTGIDWSNASVGFHTYGMNSTTGVQSMQNAMKKYPMIMTEMGSESQIPLFEKAGVAFIGWGGMDPSYVTWGGTVQPPPADNNAKPSVSFVAPAPGSSFPVGTPIKVAVRASDTDGSISKVALLCDARFIGSKTVGPFEWSITGLSAGDYTFSATATDNDGATGQAMLDIRVGTPSLAQTDVHKSAITQPSGIAKWIGPTGIVLRQSGNAATTFDLQGRQSVRHLGSPRGRARRAP